MMEINMQSGVSLNNLDLLALAFWDTSEVVRLIFRKSLLTTRKIFQSEKACEKSHKKHIGSLG